MRWSFWMAVGLVGCGDKDEDGGVTCEEGSIAIHGECVVGGSGTGVASDDGGDGTDDATGGGSGAGGTTGGGGVSTDATIEILTPETGTMFVDPWVNVTFKVDGCNLSAPSADPSGCHIHRTINGMAYEDPDTVEDPGGWGHYSADPVDMYMGDPGGKNIRFVLIRNDGSDQPFEPQVSDLVSVIIQGDSEPETLDDTASDDSGSADTASSDTETVDTGSSEDTSGGDADTGTEAEGDTSDGDDPSGGEPSDSDSDDGPFEGDDPGECEDGADNDRDGLFDCLDPDCFGAPACRGSDDDSDDDSDGAAGPEEDDDVGEELDVDSDGATDPETDDDAEDEVDLDADADVDTGGTEDTDAESDAGTSADSDSETVGVPAASDSDGG